MRRVTCGGWKETRAGDGAPMRGAATAQRGDAGHLRALQSCAPCGRAASARMCSRRPRPRCVLCAALCCTGARGQTSGIELTPPPRHRCTGESCRACHGAGVSREALEG